MAAAVCNLMQRLGIFEGPYAFAGHSLGGSVALLVTRIAPALPVFFLSLEGTICSADCVEGGLARQIAGRSAPPSSAEVLEILKPLDKAGIWAPSAASIGESLGQLSHMLFTSLVELCDSKALLEIFASLPVVLYIYGESSGKYHESMRAAIASHKNAQVKGVRDAGHFMLSDKPAETVAAVQELLASGSVPDLACLAEPQKGTL
eukprot:gnl/TRDRNA2_/TRDRNA2_173800_c0_seq3.p1 gnl/TRDRNA2_/TRDRNA2_173800_c0~~gnl/TRDRNA2_/TRDRNA2_173800_c0_seq3.p1  ORF type:complete len:205 (+),score=39.68 gnl/TRDRNA2_/TRDRNA2_173800_c0_seq3:239-853(+)